MSVFAGNKLRWAGGAVLVVVAAGLSGIVTMFTLPNVLPGVERGRLADAPIATSPASRSAAAAIALVEDQEPATLDMAERLATATVMDDPLDVSAIRTLSFVQAYRGNAQQAMRLLRYGESLSRRDLMTELALGLDAQQTAGDAAAIRHYGHALSTTRRGYDLIVTQVLEASQDPAFARALGVAMADRPTWRDRFLPAFVGRNENPEALTAMAQGLWSKGVPVADRGTAAAVTSRLLRLGAADDAATLIGMIRGKDARLVQNGDFEETDARALGWRYESGASLSALPVPDEEGRGRVLEVHAGSGHLGSVARQMLALAPGQYRLSARLSANAEADAGMPRVTIGCDSADDELADLRRSETGERVAMSFAIPNDCPVQFLDVVFGSSMFVTDSRGRVDDIAIEAP